MRIITGKYKGRVLETLPDKSVRPATDRVKTTIFDMLQNRLGLKGILVLDMFAGSGSLGFEALSRGAGKVVFVDDMEEILDVMEKNAESLNCIPDTEIIRSDAMSYIEKSNRSFDLIFADPPYSFERINEIPRIIFEKNILNSDGYLIIEHSKRTVFDPSPLYSLAVQKEFGNTRVSFFIHHKLNGDEV